MQNGVNGPNAQYWWSPSIAISDSPSAEFNDGPTICITTVTSTFWRTSSCWCPGLVGNIPTSFSTAPAAGTYSIVSRFRGAQYCIGTVVGVVQNGTVAFSSKVTAEGQLVPFNRVVSLNAGNTVVFSVGPGGGCQNTGLSATITPTQTFFLPLQITTTVLPNAKSGQAYITALEAAAGSGTGYTWCIQTGSGCVQSGSPLPTGFFLVPAVC